MNYLFRLLSLHYSWPHTHTHHREESISNVFSAQFCVLRNSV